MAQLKMIFDANNTALPEMSIAEGFRLRTVQDCELALYNELRTSVEFPAWEPENLQAYRNKVLPDGLYLIEEIATGRFAASAGAESTDLPEVPTLGVLGWVITHPDMRGKYLGKTACIAAMHKLYQENYRAFSLKTDDFRIAAIKTYLRLGWQPWLYLEDMQERWQKLAELLDMKFEDLRCLPADWPVPPMGNTVK